jgi:poly(beta-D-mannuronate) lyase
MMKFAIILCGLLIHASLAVAEHPAKVLDLSHWRLTLPVDTAHRGHPDELSQPELDSFVHPSYFFVNEGATGVVFRAHCGGITTKGSKYPRCELREMRDHGGRIRAEWGTDDDIIHTMAMRVSITQTPPVKKHVVCAQIHDADDDVLMVRLEGTKLLIERSGIEDVVLDRDYKLGTPFALKIQAGNRHIKVWHNDVLKLNWNVSRTGCYFKAGCYTQSNPSKGDTADAFGEVLIYRLQVEHRKQP